MLTVAQAAERLGRTPGTVRRWIRQGRLPAQHLGALLVVNDRDVRAIQDELYPMADLPAEWRHVEDGTVAPNVVAAVAISRRGQ